ncbi:Fur2 [Cordylochernes scorpioides]|uniref:Fur2 n=1 Tax=Cordylochernes scorpioides TaxID=51811 RepID=A0ABY6KVJ4_9ARAC|nr:Fur2 [Cordylochernes scorpioides]
MLAPRVIGDSPRDRGRGHDTNLDAYHRDMERLPETEAILWVEQQHAKRRVKRELSFSHVTDPLYSQQWYLSHGARDGYDMNVLPAWEAGYTGKGVVVTILDDGIQTNHPDLIQNYDPLASTDINGNDDDPSPQDDNKNKHGTRCAGEVAATAFNEFCGIGIAFNASIGVTDEVEARALSLNRDHIHIYSASWGPEDDGKTVDGPGRLAKQAFIEGIQQGRGGKGSIFVWASGNGGRFKDNCNCDGYTNSIYTLSISSATQEGQKPWYLEECSSTLASTYSSGTFGQDLSVVTVDMDTSYFKQLGKNKNPDISRLCTKSHTGTSASAPLAAGICALALEANPNLTWRDMQHLTVMTSRPQPLLHVEGWSTNGVGRHFSHKFGYGMMDAAAMVNLAKSWSTVPPQVVCRTQVFSDHWVIQPHTPLEVSINTDGCRDTTSEVNFLEHVQVVLSLNFHPRGSLHIQLVSPSGTRSSLLLPRPYDTDQHALTDWPFLSVHFWGEAPQGTWTLVVANEGSHLSLTSGTLFQWALVFYGTKDFPILWVEQQHAKRRVKRELSFSHVTDPLYSQQWYLSHGARDGYDMNVLPAWEAGYTGKGVVVTILDDGIQTNHPDLIQNYDPLASTDINGNDDDPSPQDDNKNKCAGEVAATAFNEFCGIGIAFNASIGGVRMLDGTVTDEVEARALSLNRDHIHIYSASWGPEDDGKTVDGPGRLAKQAFIEGIQQGRGGKGSIFVWASGNGGRFKDNCNCDGYTNSIYTLSISSATQEGQKPWYLEECSSTLASTYSSGTFGQDLSVVTVDMDTSYFKQLGKNKNPDISRLCTKSHTGTSASAPLAAGICALALEANPNLTWRDMQHLTVMTSRPQPLLHVEGWSTNGVGRHFSHKFGYGMMDAAAMVNLAKSWSTVPPQVVCRTQVFSDHWVIQPHTPLEVSINTDGCRDTTSEVNFLEHVQVVLSLNFHPRGSLHIQLVSPSGTRSSLLLPRPYDTDQHALTDWPFLSVHFWGEAPQGTWTLVVANEGSHLSLTSGTLFQWALVFYGTKDFPVRSSNHSSHHDIREATQVSECAKQKQYEYRGLCQMACPSGYYADTVLWTCEKCNNACKTCYGPLANQCLTCPDSTYLHKEICTPECPEGYFGGM